MKKIKIILMFLLIFAAFPISNILAADEDLLSDKLFVSPNNKVSNLAYITDNKDSTTSWWTGIETIYYEFSEPVNISSGRFILNTSNSKAGVKLYDETGTQIYYSNSSAGTYTIGALSNVKRIEVIGTYSNAFGGSSIADFKLYGSVTIPTPTPTVDPTPTPSTGTFNSLLGGKVITPGKNPGAPLTTTTFVTDNDESTYYAVKPEIESPSTTDFLIYNFPSPQDINAFKLYIKDYSNQKFAIGFRDSTGKEKIFYFADGSQGGDNNIYQLPTAMKDVKIAFVWNYNPPSSADLNVIEWDLYNNSLPDQSTEPSPTPIVTPSPTTTPTPEQPTGDRAILVITMNTGLEKEFDLSISEVNAFLNWYDTVSGSARYGIDKHNNNKGPYSKRTDYVVHDKILTFEVSEYTLTE
ncbi:hypothetical protein GCM10010912_06250 [Paenibacillus albidus]|uniref:Uncharacterized protein n=1 Tax=Paenibacillus albidus TaxID=2041023 RepID=A0A917FA71_9BACL|nr:hypothetical protein [Paenibacillus albidus]GGF63932.1 hypothetical protein GCM10010912_06250 [Paenibacillus albidus]